MTGEPNYVVIRPAAGLPEGFLPPHLDGLWLDMAMVPVVWAPNYDAIAVPSGRFEVREYDGAVAEVYEVRP